MIKKNDKKWLKNDLKNEDDKINDKKMMNAMITKMIKKWKNKYFKDFQCVAGSVLHKCRTKRAKTPPVPQRQANPNLRPKTNSVPCPGECS